MGTCGRLLVVSSCLRLVIYRQEGRRIPADFSFSPPSDHCQLKYRWADCTSEPPSGYICRGRSDAAWEYWDTGRWPASMVEGEGMYGISAIFAYPLSVL